VHELSALPLSHQFHHDFDCSLRDDDAEEEVFELIQEEESSDDEEKQKEEDSQYAYTPK
jgi:hypothetical protein